MAMSFAPIPPGETVQITVSRECGEMFALVYGGYALALGIAETDEERAAFYPMMAMDGGKRTAKSFIAAIDTPPR